MLHYTMLIRLSCIASRTMSFEMTLYLTAESRVDRSQLTGLSVVMPRLGAFMCSMKECQCPVGVFEADLHAYKVPKVPTWMGCDGLGWAGGGTSGIVSAYGSSYKERTKAGSSGWCRYGKCRDAPRASS